MRKGLSHGLSLVIVAIVAASCSKKPEKTILGKWHTQGDPPENVTEFRSDGTFLSIAVTLDPDNKPEFTNVDSGKYWFLDSKRMKFEINQKDSPTVLMTNQLAIHGDKIDMIVRFGQNRPQTFHLERVK